MQFQPWFSWLRAQPRAGPSSTVSEEDPQGCGTPVVLKWLPVIDRDYCTGCGLCMEACDHCCLGLVWDFATLLRPEACGSEGQCVPVCKEKLIHMEWVAATGDQHVGRWKTNGTPRAE